MPVAQPRLAPPYAARQVSDPTSSPVSPSASTSVQRTTNTGAGPTSSANPTISLTGTGDTSSTRVVLPDSTTASASSTVDKPFFPSPSRRPSEGSNEHERLVKTAVEGALIVTAVALFLAIFLWRVIRLRRNHHPVRHFFRAHPTPSVPPRPRAVPRTTGLPSVSGSQGAIVFDPLLAPVPLLHTDRRLRGGRRTRAGDIDTGGRRGTIAHPDDPEEFLPEYDDKDMLPRYQDVQHGRPSGAGAVTGTVTGTGTETGTAQPESRTGARSPNGAGGTSDTSPLVTRMELPSSTTLQDGNAPASTDSHGHDNDEHLRQENSH